MRYGTRRAWMVAALLAAAWLAAGGAAWAQPALKVALLVDLTGPTSEVGKQYAQGVQDAVAWKNEQGGINGRKIDLGVVDYGYKPPQAVAAYKKFNEQDKVLMINGWGTGDTEALKDFVNKDKIVYISASFSGHLTDPAKTPYNFFVGASYSDQLRGFLKFVKDNWKEGRAPKVAFIYADNPYGKAPIEAGRLYAKEIGVELVDEEIVPSTFQDSTSQLLNMQKKEPDFAYINTTTSWVAVILKDAQKLGLKTRFGMNPYGFGELLPQIAKEAAEGTYGVIPEVPFGTDVPGMKKIVEWNQKKHNNAFRDNLYVRGWAYGLVWMEAIRRAGSDVTRESVKNALETFRNVEFEGLVQPVTYTKEDHRPTTVINVYQVQAGKIVKAGQVELPRKKEWLGL